MTGDVRHDGGVEQPAWVAVRKLPLWVDTKPREVVATGDSRQEVLERLHLLELASDEYEVVRNGWGEQ